jgi:hypothetical protein
MVISPTHFVPEENGPKYHSAFSLSELVSTVVSSILFLVVYLRPEWCLESIQPRAERKLVVTTYFRSLACLQ